MPFSRVLTHRRSVPPAVEGSFLSASSILPPLLLEGWVIRGIFIMVQLRKHERPLSLTRVDLTPDAIEWRPAHSTSVDAHSDEGRRVAREPEVELTEAA